jgi:hypothetical protein
MGTNYSRIPKSKEIRDRHTKLTERVSKLDIWDPSNVENGFRTIGDGWDMISPWDEFMEDMSIHLGKRSSGWKFLWNFHKNKYYSNKEELLKFIRSGRIIDEYGELQDTEEFIKMTLDWGEPDGLVLDEEYFNKTEHNRWMSNPSDYYDKDVDGLRVSSSIEFS